MKAGMVMAASTAALAGWTSLPGGGPLAQGAPTTSATSTTIAPTTTVPGSVSALDVLAFIAIENERGEGYDRSRFPYPADLDGDGCDTRSEVLQRDSLIPAQINSSCDVADGDWLSTDDEVRWSDPSAVTIDHVVSLKEAWDSGAWAWDQSWRIAFANALDDERTLRVVTDEVNQDKGDADPSNWLPPSDAALCDYIGAWVAVKARWALSMDESEHGRIRNVLEADCAGTIIPPWPSAPAPPPPTTQPAPRPPPPPPLIQPVLPQQPSGCHPAYPTVCIPPPSPDLDCGDIPHRRFDVLPPDPHRFDADDDGVGCES